MPPASWTSTTSAACPVVDATGSLVGVLSQTDLARVRATEYLWSNWHGLAVRHLMSHPAETVHPSVPLALAVQKMERLRIHRLIVVDDRDETLPIGVLSLTDVVHAITLDTDRAEPMDGASAMPDDTPLIKDPGELKEAHEARLGAIAPPIFDVDSYVEEFGRSIVPAYRRGIADQELPADVGLARSIIPPGTAATRDFSRLAPRIPEFLARASASAAWPASVPAPTAPSSASSSRSPSSSRASKPSPPTQPQPDVASATARQHFAPTRSTATSRPSRGLERGAFGLFVDAVHCKGCAECVEVCTALGHDALVMIDKVDEEPAGGSTIERHARDMSFFRSLPPTPDGLPERQGARRPHARRARLRLRRRGGVLRRAAARRRPSGCWSRRRARSTARTRWGSSRRPAATRSSAARTRSTRTWSRGRTRCSRTRRPSPSASALAGMQAGHQDRRLWVLGGDGAMYDIGFQALSRMVASGADIKVLVLDTQVYSNTGGQASTASFGGQVTKMSAFGSAIHGRPEPRKELGRILMAHGDVYVAQTTPAHLNHFYRAILEANAYPGPAVVIAYSACMPEHGIADDAATRQAKLAVESRAFPLFTYDPRRGPTHRRAPVAAGQPGPARGPGEPARRDARRLPHLRAVRGPVRAPLRCRRHADDRDPGDPGRSPGELADAPGTGRASARRCEEVDHDHRTDPWTHRRHRR